MSAEPKSCPVRHKNTENSGDAATACPISHHGAANQTKAALSSPGQSGGCPMRSGASSKAESSSPASPTNSDRVNPLNLMDSHPNQTPSHDQPFELSKERQASTILKAMPDAQPDNQSATWLYPSAQMFWNAMIKKGWRWRDEDDPTKNGGAAAEEPLSPVVLDQIVRIHNTTNEQAWREVMAWEAALHSTDCRQPRSLRSFRGRASDLTPRARVRTWLGYERPFDRHDWVVERCGRDVRYLIDYYDASEYKAANPEETAAAANTPDEKFCLLDVRPALDSFGAVWDRMRICVRRWKFEWFRVGGAGSTGGVAGGTEERGQGSN